MNSNRKGNDKENPTKIKVMNVIVKNILTTSLLFRIGTYKYLLAKNNHGKGNSVSNRPFLIDCM